MASASRPRWSGSAAEMAAALRPHVERDGRSFIKYDEAKNVHQTILDKPKIVQYQKVILSCRALCPRLIFTKKIVAAAFKLLATDFEQKWKFSTEQSTDWQQTMILRLTNMLSQVHAAEEKNNLPKWLKELSWHRDDAEAGPSDPQPKSQRLDADLELVDDKAENSGKVDEEPTDYYFGWKDELQLGFRVLHGQPVHSAELSLPPDVTDQPDTAALTVCWADGSEWAVPGWTVGRFKKGMRRGGKGCDAKLWHGTKTDTHHLLSLQQRPDRVLLLSLYEQQRQVAQVKIGLFGSLPDPQPATVPKDCEALQAAVKFMVPIAMKYESCQFADTEALKAHVHDELKKIGLSARKCVAKRPAAAPGASVGKDSAKRPAAAPDSSLLGAVAEVAEEKVGPNKAEDKSGSSAKMEPNKTDTKAKRAKSSSSAKTEPNTKDVKSKEAKGGNVAKKEAKNNQANEQASFFEEIPMTMDEELDGLIQFIDPSQDRSAAPPKFNTNITTPYVTTICTYNDIYLYANMY
jgi:hypothetical protein